MSDAFCAHRGRFSMGKNVPLKRNIGVMKRKTGRLNASMLGITEVKNIPTEPKAIPPTNASGRRRRPVG